MLKNQAEFIKKNMCSGYQPIIDSTYGPNTYHVAILKDGNEYQLQSADGVLFSIVQVGMEPYKIGYVTRRHGLDVYQLKNIIKDL